MASCKDCFYIDVCAFRNPEEDEKICRCFKSTADVVEVKHGKWIDCIEQGTTVSGIRVSAFVGYRCSECGRYEGKKEPYCNCGAKMDKN